MIGAHRVLQPNVYDHDASGRCALAIMTKAPRAGEVKTRLTPPLTPEEAAELNIRFLRDTAAAIDGVASGARGIGCYTPPTANLAYRDLLPASFQLLAQRGDDFGERLRFAVEDLFRVGFAAVCLIDSDSPTVPSLVYSEAVAALAAPGDCVVLGPSADGGYYLIGMKQPHVGLFTGIDWSTERVREQTQQRANTLGLEVHLLPQFYDVDDAAGLDQLCQELLGPNDNNGTAPASRAYLRELMPGLAG